VGGRAVRVQLEHRVSTGEREHAPHGSVATDHRETPPQLAQHPVSAEQAMHAAGIHERGRAQIGPHVRCSSLDRPCERAFEMRRAGDVEFADE